MYLQGLSLPACPLAFPPCIAITIFTKDLSQWTASRAGAIVFHTVSGGPTGCYCVCFSHKESEFMTNWSLQTSLISHWIYEAPHLVEKPNVPHNSKSQGEKEHCERAKLCRCPTVPLGRKQPGSWETWWPPAAVTSDRPLVHVPGHPSYPPKHCCCHSCRAESAEGKIQESKRGHFYFFFHCFI